MSHPGEALPASDADRAHSASTAAIVAAPALSGTLTRIITKTKARMTPPHGIPKID